MEPWARKALVLGVVLCIAGAALGGLSPLFCTSGYELELERLGPNEPSPGTTESVEYDELSLESQEAFDDAYSALQRSGSDRGGSRVYTNQTRVSTLSGRVITYDGERYHASAIVVDCGVSLASIPLVGGVILLLVVGVPWVLERVGLVS